MENKKDCCNHENNVSRKPPKSTILIGLSAAAVIIGLFMFFRYGSGGTALLWEWSNGGQWLFPLVTVSALLDSINPCAFSILLLTIAFLFSIGRLRANIFKIGIIYIFGIFLIYLLIGLGILQTLHLFNTPHFMAKFGAGMLIILGLINLINDFFPAFPLKLKIPTSAHHTMAKLIDKASMPAAFLLGVLVGICEFPCTGGPYLMILGLLHDQAKFFNGLWYLILYNLIFILPLVIMLWIAADRSLLDTLEKWKQKNNKRLRLGSGIIMVILGILILSL